MVGVLKDLNRTMSIATHDLELVLELCDRALLLYDGTVIAEGSCREIQADRLLLEKSCLEVLVSLRVAGLI